MQQEPSAQATLATLKQSAEKAEMTENDINDQKGEDHLITSRVYDSGMPWPLVCHGEFLELHTSMIFWTAT